MQKINKILKQYNILRLKNGAYLYTDMHQNIIDILNHLNEIGISLLIVDAHVQFISLENYSIKYKLKLKTPILNETKKEKRNQNTAN